MGRVEHLEGLESIKGPNATAFVYGTHTAIMQWSGTTHTLREIGERQRETTFEASPAGEDERKAAAILAEWWAEDSHRRGEGIADG